ncbi:unnamed protein product [Cochlearia groenlandica]
MADIEMQEQDVISVADDVFVDTTDYLEEEPLQIEYQNPSEIPEILDNDVNLAGDVVAYEDVDGQANGHEEENGDVGVVNHSVKKTDTDLQVVSLEAGDENAKKRKTWLLSDSEALVIDEAGTPDEQKRFRREVETFYKENFLEFKAPMFYRQPVNILKLWRAVVKLGGYEVVTVSKLWRQVGESFNPPKTCTTVSYTFRNFYEKALVEYENYLTKNGELDLPGSTFILPSSNKKDASGHQGPGSGRAQRESAARAMKGWHAQRDVESGEVIEPMVNEKSLNSTPKHKKLKSIGMQKQKTQTSMDLVVSHETDEQSVADVIDVGPLAANWVKINVKETNDSYEVFALVPGLVRSEVRIQSDPAGKLIITGLPEQLENPWGITPFKKIVELSRRIDPLHTSAVMSMHGRIFIRVPFEKL